MEQIFKTIGIILVFGFGFAILGSALFNNSNDGACCGLIGLLIGFLIEKRNL